MPSPKILQKLYCLANFALRKAQKCDKFGRNESSTTCMIDIKGIILVPSTMLPALGHVFSSDSLNQRLSHI